MGCPVVGGPDFPFTPSGDPGLHPNEFQQRWLDHRHLFTYFAFWRTDEVKVECQSDMEEISGCLTTAERYGDILRLDFTGAGLGATEKSVSATDVFGAAPAGVPFVAGFPVFAASPAKGDLSAAGP